MMLHDSPSFSSYSVHSSDRSASSNTAPPAAFTTNPSPGVHRVGSQPLHSKHTTGTHAPLSSELSGRVTCAAE